MAIFMTSSLMGLVGFELIGIAISRRIYRRAACVQRGDGRCDRMVVSRKFGDPAPKLYAARNIPWAHREQPPGYGPGDAVMARTKLFRSNRSQAVRLPKSLAFPNSVKEVMIGRGGKRPVIAPSNAAWDDLFDSPGVDLPARSELMGRYIPKNIPVGPKSRQALRVSITRRNSKPGLTIDRLQL
jgi:antitoxin VapB